MIAWVVVLHWLRVCDYSFCYSVCYQQTVFVVSLCGCVCPIVLFVNVFVLCNGTIKMLIAISGFTCLCQCIFLIICNLSSFFERNGGKYVLRFCLLVSTNSTILKKNIFESNIIWKFVICIFNFSSLSVALDIGTLREDKFIKVTLKQNICYLLKRS